MGKLLVARKDVGSGCLPPEKFLSPYTLEQQKMPFSNKMEVMFNIDLNAFEVIVDRSIKFESPGDNNAEKKANNTICEIFSARHKATF